MRTSTTILFLTVVPLLSLHARHDDEGLEDDLAASAPAMPETSSNAGAARSIEATYASIADRVWPSVVTVRAYERVAPEDAGPVAVDGWVADEEDTYPGFREYAALSGWVVREDGEILTCNHGLVKADGSLPDLIDFETHDYQRVVAERVGIEPTVNIAILQAMVWPNSHPKTLPALEWGESDGLRSGHTLLAFGDPSGPKRFLQTGMFISQPSRDCYQDLLSAFYMQLGMVAHPESYGGPLVDLDGRVVGMIAPEQVRPGTWTESERFGVEYGLPSKIVKGLHEAIRHVRSFKSPWLGYAVMSRPEIAKVRGIEAFQSMNKPRNGILIENVYKDGPAFVSGIQPGDWLVTFNETKVFTPVDFQKALYMAGIGTQVRVEIFRDGETSWHELVIEERPSEAAPR